MKGSVEKTTTISKNLKEKKNQTIFFKNPPKIIGNYAIVGPKEGHGPVAKYFDYILKTDSFNEKTYEKAERKMMEQAISGATAKAGLLLFVQHSSYQQTHVRH